MKYFRYKRLWYIPRSLNNIGTLSLNIMELLVTCTLKLLDLLLQTLFHNLKLKEKRTVKCFDLK